MYAREDYHNTLEQIPTDAEIARLAARVYPQVFRTDFTEPGFALVSFLAPVESLSLRRFLVAFKEALETVYQKKTGRHLHYQSLMQFDQQNTTKFHLDGGPEESYLMLGYEPSDVQSVLHMADYSRAAQDLNLTPQQFLTDYNPMFARGAQILAKYTTRVEGFDTRFASVLLVNNSRLPFRLDDNNTLGVMHQASILTPDPKKSRVINSTLFTPVANTASAASVQTMRLDFLDASTD